MAKIKSHKIQLLIVFSLFFFLSQIATVSTILIFVTSAQPWALYAALVIGLGGTLLFIFLAVFTFFFWKKAFVVEEDKVGELSRDFIANASHELKTPVTIVRGFAETLYEHPELSKEITRDITKRILDGCDRMVSLVKSLLILATVDEDISLDRLRKCDLREVAELACSTVLALHPSAEIKVIADKDVFMMADKDLLLQALINLLDNGVKYSKDKARVEVILSQNSRETRIEVRDFGRGIAKENKKRIFERFYAVDKQLSRSLGGYGLGLSIVQRIVEKHHGRIDVQSKEGQGSSFFLIFPR